MHGVLRSRRLRSLLTPATLLALLLLALVPAGGMLLETTVALLGLLTAVVVTHFRLEAGLPTARTARPPALASPISVGIALTAVVAIGSLTAIALAILVSAVAKLGGDGRGLLRILLAIFVLLPCLSIGARSGRWWAFSGSLLLVPVAGVCVLIVGPRSGHGAAEVLFVFASTGFVVAVGSLQHRLQTAARSRPNRAPRAARPDAERLVVEMLGQQDRAKRRAHG